jgi:hypothetical protein
MFRTVLQGNASDNPNRAPHSGHAPIAASRRHRLGIRSSASPPTRAFPEIDASFADRLPAPPPSLRGRIESCAGCPALGTAGLFFSLGPAKSDISRPAPNERLILRIFIGNGQHDKSLVLEFLVGRLQIGHLFSAGRAPRRQKLTSTTLPFESFSFHVCPRKPAEKNPRPEAARPSAPAVRPPRRRVHQLR